MADEAQNPADQTISEPVQSIEVEGQAKKESEAKDDDAGEASDNDAPGEDEDGIADNADGKLSNDLYKAYKAITEVLLNHKIKLKNNE